MSENLTDWKAIGDSKRDVLLSLIPEEWRIQLPLPSPAILPDVTGHIRQYLSLKEVEITDRRSRYPETGHVVQLPKRSAIEQRWLIRW
ncbi:hypothetical protein BGAL_0046g00410 [Botrytis galanthina]|uniref:Uncharacterized protein n=1 Tax=Botrytis galanthina TaxID=278940 RepID=A0A4S8RB22_9HELO|nr:hypothetical protein BGAL_0046g00410 [Botrytis galanthina]